MTLKILLLTNQSWKTWPKKIAAIEGGLSLAKGIKPVVDLRIDADMTRPTIDERRRITSEWFDGIQRRYPGYHAYIVHFSRKDGRLWNLVDGVRGSHVKDDDAPGEMWICADEDDEIIFPNGKRVNRFVKVALHEFSHWFAWGLGVKDETHHWDYSRYNIHGVFKNYRFTPSFWEKLVARLMPLHHPLGANRNTISQAFGVRNPRYKSGIHMGTDYAVPVGTPVYAPTVGQVTRVWENHPTMGNALLFEFAVGNQRYVLRALHLREVPKRGIRGRGQIIGYTGNTGASTGPHAHLDTWRNAYRPEFLSSEQTVRENLVDPEILFA